jgi:predicted small lipoprotein YifL
MMSGNWGRAEHLRVRGQFTVRADRLVLITALIAALGVSGCGRKGPLDPPPSALTDNQASASGQPVVQRPALGEEGGNLLASPLDSGRPRTQAPTQPPPPPKNFFLDFLIR